MARLFKLKKDDYDIRVLYERQMASEQVVERNKRLIQEFQALEAMMVGSHSNGTRKPSAGHVGDPTER